MKNLVLINESHSLFDEQKEILDNRFGNWEFFKVPSQGWTLEQMRELILPELKKADVVVFASPVPYLLLALATLEGGKTNWNTGLNRYHSPDVKIFHNDKRIKKELPNGKIIQVVSDTGWQLV